MPEFEFPYGQVVVFDDSPTHREIDIHLIIPSSRVESRLNALWTVSMFGQVENGGPFGVGDYYQSSIRAVPDRRGLGPLLLEYVATNRHKLGFVLNNFYSTNVAVDGTPVTEAGRRLWEKMARLGKAKFLEDIGRFRLVWQ